MTFIAGFSGYWVAAIGIVLAFFNVGAGLLFLSIGLALMAWSSMKTPPDWAFEQAHRGSKTMWRLLLIIGLIPPLGLVYFGSWAIAWRAVERAWASGDPASYGGYLALRRRRRAVASGGGSPNSGNQWPTSSGTGGGGPCGVCGGRGWHYSDGQGNKMPCYACGGSGRR